MQLKINFYTILFSLTFIFNYGQSNNSHTHKNPVSGQLFSEASLLNHIKTLSSDTFEGRRTGTRGALKARKYIINEFNNLGVLPLIENYEQPFSFSEKGKSYQGVNILGLVKGTEYPNTYIVISGHYDHEGIKNGEIYNGADDDASGVSALFSFAEYFKLNPPKHSIILAAFDAEELGLQGSKYFVNHPNISLKAIMVNLNMDMISRSDTHILYAVGTRYNKTLKYLISNFKQSDGAKLIAGHDGQDNLENWTYSSDHASFYKKRIPFIYFGVDDHEDYHMPTDDYDRIQPKFYIESVKNIILVFKQIDVLNF
ncbi:M28 family peptidase [Yeosuana marina]|uniref:M28 family peptidase n=1 Tax=Yeosuana marina TaxID=1565536 RepID=UPI0030EDF5D3|tara:strand:- start:2162 stop:3100 length:939 start_codon:yes stop_codon:yes gene_type:complete